MVATNRIEFRRCRIGADRDPLKLQNIEFPQWVMPQGEGGFASTLTNRVRCFGGRTNQSLTTLGLRRDQTDLIPLLWLELLREIGRTSGGCLSPIAQGTTTARTNQRYALTPSTPASIDRLSPMPPQQAVELGSATRHPAPTDRRPRLRPIDHFSRQPSARRQRRPSVAALGV